MSKKNHQELQDKFGENLRKIRDQKGLSLRAVAANCDLDDSNISKIENGKLNIQLSTIIELGKGLGIDPRDLLNF
ncbi:helix-turn-helix domain-containing protein [Pedobacter metabolipauper]|uniref:Helix-turn-helix protein n=1 Tax=Pedobacter metabolipauper TaxID=425513 RepID=A0A4R6STB7_9SPHI|nr:helix-turn-helix transcriptional regulator [Pedobacter metabolipauper]TDQ07115.1 helix-turn-helix protein [Pedobacter metabolipauper]